MPALAVVPCSAAGVGRGRALGVSITISAAPVRVEPHRRAAFAMAALRAVPEPVCRRVTLVTGPFPDPCAALVVAAEAEDGSGRPLRVVQWLWWRDDGRTVRVVLIADPHRTVPAGGAMTAAPAAG